MKTPIPRISGDSWEQTVGLPLFSCFRPRVRWCRAGLRGSPGAGLPYRFYALSNVRLAGRATRPIRWWLSPFPRRTHASRTVWSVLYGGFVPAFGGLLRVAGA